MSAVAWVIVAALFAYLLVLIVVLWRDVRYLKDHVYQLDLDAAQRRRARVS